VGQRPEKDHGEPDQLEDEHRRIDHRFLSNHHDHRAMMPPGAFLCKVVLSARGAWISRALG
jgi:hypothetical protein